MRLQSTVNTRGHSAAAQVILRAMKRYGIVLAGGANIGLTSETDRLTTTNWSALWIKPQTFSNGANDSAPLLVRDFKIVDTGLRSQTIFIECALQSN